MTIINFKCNVLSMIHMICNLSPTEASSAKSFTSPHSRSAQQSHTALIIVPKCACVCL